MIICNRTIFDVLHTISRAVRITWIHIRPDDELRLINENTERKEFNGF